MARKRRWEPTAVVDGVAQVDLLSWRYFYEYLHQELLGYRTYIFRGQQCDDWPLSPTFDRMAARTRRSAGRTHLTAFKRAARGRRGPNPQPIADDDENEWWALGQHYGLATPLLDWTTSPFVAAYFAFVDEDHKDQTERRAIYALAEYAVVSKSRELRKAHTGKSRPPIMEFIRPRYEENLRLLSQGGLFTRGPRDVDVEQWVRRHFAGDNENYILLKITVPNRDRVKCLLDLNRMTVNHLSLFPDLHGASEFCNMGYEIDGY